MPFNQALFNDFAARAQANNRRMTLQEATAAGLPEEEYYKLYGGPDTAKFTAAQAYYASRGERIPVKALVEMGFNPVEIPKIYGDPPVQTLNDLYGQEQQRVRRATDIAATGTRGSGSNIGEAREINGAILAPAPKMDAAQIGPVARVNDISLGNATGMNAAVIDPVTQTAKTVLGPADKIALENAFRDKQTALAAELEATAKGERPSLAALQMKEAADRTIAQASGLIASQRGVNAGLATRLAVNNAATVNQDTAMKSAQLRLGETIAARQELAQLTGQARTQDTAVQAANQQAANEFKAKQAELDTGVNAANAQAANARAANNAQLVQQANQFTAQAQNERAVAQGDITARLQLANQLAENNQNITQAQLVQGANQANQQSALTTNVQQGTLTQQANLANQQAVNQMEATRGQTAAGIQQSQISGSAQVSAAGASAAGQVAAANIDANASVFNNTVDNATQLSIAQQQGGIAYGVSNADYSANQDQVNQQNTATAANTASSAGSTAVSVYSDKRLKKDVKPADTDIERFLSALAAKEYHYKDEKNGKGEKVGVMAQDLEKSPVGKTMVEDTPSGKVVDFGKGLGAMLASLASLNKRLQELEGRA